MKAGAPTTAIGPREVARLFLKLTPGERRALKRWHGEWVTRDGEFTAGDWPGWSGVLDRLGESPEAAGRGGAP